MNYFNQNFFYITCHLKNNLIVIHIVRYSFISAIDSILLTESCNQYNIQCEFIPGLNHLPESDIPKPKSGCPVWTYHHGIPEKRL